MKKTVSLLFVILSVILLFTACGEEEHTYTEWETVTQATCTEGGFITRSCTHCDRVENQKVAALGHKEEAVQAKAATCTEDGCTEGSSCANCGEIFVESKILPKLGHTVKVIAGKAATCTESGLSDGEKCQVCNTVLKEQNEIAALEHNYKAQITKTASCEGAGTKKYTCANCNKSYTESYSITKYEANELYKKLEKSVGEIVVSDKSGVEVSLGTCFVISADGKIVTNFHVIEDAYSAKVYLDNKTYTVSSVLAFDESKDLAVLKINASGLTPLSLCEKAHDTGITVYALGSSRGLTSTFTKGIITHANRVSGGVTYVQHDAAISSGNSGGPLVNEYGEVIGVNTMYIKDSQNLNLAVAVKEINSLTYGKAMTLAQMQESLKGNAYETLLKWIKQNGEYDGEYYDIWEYDDTETNMLNVYYDVAEDYVVSRILNRFDSGGKLDTYLILKGDGIFEFWSYYTFADGTEWYSEGTLNGATFSMNTTLSFTRTDANASAEEALAEMVTMAMEWNIAWLGEIISDMDLTVADLGFTAFKY